MKFLGGASYKGVGGGVARWPVLGRALARRLRMKDEGGRMKALGKGHWAGGCFTADLALGGQRLGGQVGQTRLVGQLAEVPVK